MLPRALPLFTQLPTRGLPGNPQDASLLVLPTPQPVVKKKSPALYVYIVDGRGNVAVGIHSYV
jgi:hypothetical protein